MILSGQEIKKHMGKEIIIEPFDEKRINPNSYNLSLAGELLVYDNHVLDMKEPNPVSRIIIPEDGFLLEPNRLYPVSYTHLESLFKRPGNDNRSDLSDWQSQCNAGADHGRGRGVGSERINQAEYFEKLYGRRQ